MDDFNKRYIEFSRPFIEALKGVYKTMMEIELFPGTPSIKKEDYSNGDYSAVMGINGLYEKESKRAFKGSLVITWTEQCYLATASKMLMEEFTSYDPEIKDVGMEICNMTMGNAKKVLTPAGFKIEMSVPTSVVGKGHVLRCEDGVTTIVTPIESDFGRIVIEINYDDFEAD